jgi:DNA-binding XRE family transcriptional regulator
MVYGVIYNMDYSKVLKVLREKMLVTQTELAELLEVSFQTVNRWETGKHEPTIKAKRKSIDH